MRSEIARFLEEKVLERNRKMTPAQRVKAFIEHSRRLKAIQAAGARRRLAAEAESRKSSDG
jgi:hypothetical protein